MKKNIVFIAFALIFSLLISFCAYAADDEVIGDSKDGIVAEMTVNYDPSAPSLPITVDLKVTNESADDVSNIVATISFDELFALQSGSESMPLTLPLGESAELNYSFINTDTVETVGSTPATEEASGGCGAVISGTAVIFAMICSACFIVKDPKRGAACLIACVMLASALVLPSNAATTERKIELVGTVIYNETEYEIKATVSYDHTFIEEKGIDTKGMEKFEITYYWGPQGKDLCNEEYIKKIAECGFTSIPIEGYDPTINKTALGYLRKYGMTCSALADYRILNALATNDQATIDVYIQDVANDYKDYLDVIKGWLLRDEPSASDFPALARVVDAVHRIDPERTTMINLFPTYASDKQLGTNGYQEHLDKFVEIVKPDYISYDHYHFQKSTTRKGFFENIEAIRDTAIKNELDPMLIILLTEHNSYADLTKYQIEWEVNMCLTYGMKRISYFTYWLSQDLLDQGWNDACMDCTGKIYPHYYDVQEINKWILPLGTELFDKNSTAVFHTRSKGGGSLEKGCEVYKSYGDLGEISTDASVVIGFFDDNSFMITNRMYNDTEKARNTVEFLDIASGLEYFDTVSASWKDAESTGAVAKNENGNLYIILEPGQGVLFRVAD